MDKLTNKQLIAAMLTFKSKTGASLEDILDFVKEIAAITTDYGISLMKEKIHEIANREAGK
jgi:hypothetical protein